MSSRTTPEESTKKTRADKSRKPEEEAAQPAPSATPDRGEESSLEKQAKPAFSPSRQSGDGSSGMGPGPATSVVGSPEGVVEATIPDGPSAEDD